MDLIFTGSIVIVAAAFRGVTGFGYALIAALGLAVFMAPSDVAPIILINDLVMTGLILLDRKQGAVDWPVARQLLAAGFVGALVGGLLVGAISDDAARVIVSAIVLVSALVALIHHPPAWLSHRGLGAAIAFLTGAVLSAFAVGGPLIAAWLLAGGVSKDRVRGTLAVFFGAVDLFSVLSRAALGGVSGHALSLEVFFLPLTLAGYGIGLLLARRMSPASWQRISAWGLMLIALAGAAQTLYLLA